MSIKERLEICRLSYEIFKYKEFSKKIGITEESKFKDPGKNKDRKEVMK